MGFPRPKWYSVPDLAEYWKVGTGKIERYIETGQLVLSALYTTHDKSEQFFVDLNPGETMPSDRDITKRRDVSWEWNYVKLEEVERFEKVNGLSVGDNQGSVCEKEKPKTALAPYLDPKQKCYSLKLAVAIEAWEAVTADPNRLKNTTPKQALLVWLNDNSKRYKLTKKAIEEIAKVANWKPGGPSDTPQQ